MRKFTIELGGVLARSTTISTDQGMVYIVEGRIADRRDGETTECESGVGWHEDGTTMHWIENASPIQAVEISFDSVRAL